MKDHPAPIPEARQLAAQAGQVFPLIRHCSVKIVDPFEAYCALTDCAPHSFFLEHDDQQGGIPRRYAYMGSEPEQVITGKADVTTIRSRKGSREVGNTPFSYLADFFSSQPPQLTQKMLPFQGGIVGCLSYDVVRSFERLPEFARDDLQVPDVYGLVVETFAVIDQHSPGAWLVFAPSPERVAAERWDVLFREGMAKLAELEGKLKAMPERSPEKVRDKDAHRIVGEQSASEYQDRVRACQEFIAAGDIYQANLSHRFRVENLVDQFQSRAQAGASLFRRIRRANPSPHSAFLVLDSDVIICNSPERLVRLTDGVADMRPIAGTRPRGDSTSLDRRLAEELVSHPKERAEHLMLVDLVRNDLGRVCRYGTVRVDELMTVERYSHVMHLVSNISGRISETVSPWDLLRAVFPGGTISGVPKVHCMELIEQLEPIRRGFYTGSLGFVGWNGQMDWNIIIRTLLLRETCGYLQVGAGIVADSVPALEYEETIHKAEAFFKVLRSH